MPRKAATAHEKALRRVKAGKKPPTDLELAIAARLRAIQAEMGKTDEGMGEFVGCGRSNWANWINAGNMPKAEYMVRLCELASVTMDWLYRETLKATMPLPLAIRLTARLRGTDPDRADASILVTAR
jgi:hypothetical protein